MEKELEIINSYLNSLKGEKIFLVSPDSIKNKSEILIGKYQYCNIKRIPSEGETLILSFPITNNFIGKFIRGGEFKFGKFEMVWILEYVSPKVQNFIRKMPMAFNMKFIGMPFPDDKVNDCALWGWQK